MMMSVHRTLIVPAELVESARAIADQFGPSAQGMWITPLSPSGGLPATHYISAGKIDADFAWMLESPQNLIDGAYARGVTVSLSDAEALLTASDVSTEEPFVALARLGLQLINTSIEI
jgi:hypothetical protein